MSITIKKKAKKRELTDEEKLFQLALRTSGIHTQDSTVCLAFRVFKRVSEVGDEFNLRDAAKLEAEVKKLYPEDEEAIAEEEEKVEEGAEA